MGLIARSVVTAAITAAGVSYAAAETLPPVLAGFPAEASDARVEEAFAERIRASFPRDIRSGTLSALLKMDGFSVRETRTGYAASYMQADFPCITDYVLTWQDGETGRVEDLRVQTSQKCV